MNSKLHSRNCEIILKNRGCYAMIMSKSLMMERIIMPVSYDKLWKLLIDRKMTRTDLKESSGVSFNIIAKMGKNEFVSMDSLHKICVSLKCGIDEVMEFTDL